MSTANISNYGKYLQIIGNTNKNGVKILSYVAFYLLDAIAAEGDNGDTLKNKIDNLRCDGLPEMQFCAQGANCFSRYGKAVASGAVVT
jgi:hypothetical protein